MTQQSFSDGTLTEEVTEFISQSQLLRALPEALRHSLAEQARISYLPQGHHAGDLQGHLVLVRSGHWHNSPVQGSVSDNSPDSSPAASGSNNRLSDFADSHHCFAVNTLQDAQQWQVSEDSLVYLWPRSALESLGLAHLMAQAGTTVDSPAVPDLQAAERGESAQSPLLTLRIGQLQPRKPVTVTADVSVRSACQLMSQHSISCLPVLSGTTDSSSRESESESKSEIESKSQQGCRLVGILTDRDLRQRVLADGLDGTALVGEVMTTEPLTISSDALLTEALLLMSEHGIHHLPVCSADDPKRLCGVITGSDIMQQQQSSPVALASAIQRQQSVEALARLSRQFHPLLVQLQALGTDPDVITRLLTQLSDSVTRRLITLATDKLGPAPCAWAWLAFGSQGRQEQGACSDQDNGLLLSEQATDEMLPWFRQMADFVCQGLAACGYALCPGKIMAFEPRWMQRQSGWLTEYRQWVEQPTPKALMHASIFFDWRVVAGDSSLAQPLRDYLQQAIPKSSLFLSHLTANALSHTPPLGILGRLLVERDGQQSAKTLDLKLRGLVPLIDLARIYALASGSAAVSTRERLQAIDSRWLGEADRQQLLQVWQRIAALRLAHHAACLEGGQAATNRLDPRQLTPLERQQLKQAFAIVAQAQDALQLKMNART